MLCIVKGMDQSDDFSFFFLFEDRLVSIPRSLKPSEFSLSQSKYMSILFSLGSKCPLLLVQPHPEAIDVSARLDGENSDVTESPAPKLAGVLQCRTRCLPFIFCCCAIMRENRQLLAVVGGGVSDVGVGGSSPVMILSTSTGEMAGSGSRQQLTSLYSLIRFPGSLCTGGKKWSATSVIFVYLEKRHKILYRLLSTTINMNFG